MTATIQPTERLAYFGNRYDAPAYDKAIRIASPFNQQCAHCDEPIARDDNGFRTYVTGGLTSTVGCRGGYSYAHRECHIAQSTPEAKARGDDRLTRRENALVTCLKFYRRVGGDYYKVIL